MLNMQSKWIAKSRSFTWTHTETSTPLICSIIDDALLKAMPAVHNIGQFTLWIFLNRPAAEFLFTFCSSLGSYLGVGATGLNPVYYYLYYYYYLLLTGAAFITLVFFSACCSLDSVPLLQQQRPMPTRPATSFRGYILVVLICVSACLKEAASPS